jgi:hypothetical protein
VCGPDFRPGPVGAYYEVELLSLLVIRGGRGGQCPFPIGSWGNAGDFALPSEGFLWNGVQEELRESIPCYLGTFAVAMVLILDCSVLVSDSCVLGAVAGQLFEFPRKPTCAESEEPGFSVEI